MQSLVIKQIRITQSELNYKIKERIKFKKHQSSYQRTYSTSPNQNKNLSDFSPNKKKIIDHYQLERIPQKRKKKNKKNIKKNKEMHNYLVGLKNMKPVNLQKQFQIFQKLNSQYNPYFIYNTSINTGKNKSNCQPILAFHLKEDFGSYKPHSKYLSLAIRILEKCVKQKIEQKLQKMQSINIQDTSIQFDRYIRQLGIQNFISYQFAQNTVAPTSVIHNNQQGTSKVIIGLPIQYKSNTVINVLNHQIGTHFLRKYNDKFQKWYKDRKKYSMKHYLKHQQGLASINQHYQMVINNQIPLMYKSALHYYACYMASKYSFSQLYHDLKKFVSNSQARWKECVRVKRGIADTSDPGGMYKDQIYLRGAISILKYRKVTNLIMLHSGKMSIKDCIRFKDKNLIMIDKCKYGYFLKDYDKYMYALNCIAKQNFIDEVIGCKAIEKENCNKKN